MSERFPETRARAFEFALKKTNEGKVKAFKDAKLPEYATKHSAAADFYCAESVLIPSIWGKVVNDLCDFSVILQEKVKSNSLKYEDIMCVLSSIKPTLVHTGVKACMLDDEVLHLYNRSSNPMKLGLVLANGVGVVDADYYNNPDNDGEIMFAFYNLSTEDVVLNVGDRVGQGEFVKFLRPNIGCRVREEERVGGFGSTGK